MRALTWDGNKLELAARPEPAPGPGEVILRPTLAGICRTDLEIVRGYLHYRGVLGHELVGEVVAGPPRWLGKRVVAEINASCGHCPTCAQGLGRHCPDRRVLGIVGAEGAFSERVRVPVASLHEVPSSLADEQAVFVEPLAAAFEILEQVPVRSGTPALVLGDGKLGLLVALVLARVGARVRAVGKHEGHLRLLRARGVEAVELASWDRAPAELVVEATGRADGFALALAATRPRGTLVLKTTVAEPLTLDLAPIVIHEIAVVGSRCGPFAPALAALADGSIDPRPLIEARWPLSGAIEAFEWAARPGALKVLLEPGR